MCHAECGGGDIVTFEKKLFNCDDATAMKNIEQLLDIKNDFKPKERHRKNGKRGEFDRSYSYRDEDGNELFQAVRYKNPKDFSQRRPDGNGGWIYNLNGVRLVPYHLPELRRATGRVYIVEGEKDVERLESMKLTATCLPMGAGKWRDEYAQYFEHRSVVVVPDNDPAKPKGNKYPGQQHAATVMRALLPVAESVSMLEIPDVKDISDWLDKYGEDNLGTLDSQRVLVTIDDIDGYAAHYANDPVPELQDEPTPTTVTDELPETCDDGAEPPPRVSKNGNIARPENALSMVMMKEHTLLTDNAENIYEYDDTIWKPISLATLKSYAQKLDNRWMTKRARRGEIIDFAVNQSYMQDIPWHSILEHEVPLKNGVLDLRTMKLRPHRKSDYLDTVVPIEYDPTAKCPVWMKAMEMWWAADNKEVPNGTLKMLSMQEFAGYVLMHHAKYKKCLFLYGEPDSGKSQALLMLEMLVGAENVCKISVKDMEDPRKLAPIKGKLLNSMSDLPANAMIADGGFKQLVSTGDSIQIDQKYQKAETYTPIAKHVIVSNSLPRVNDMTMATYNRILLIAFNHAIPKEQQDRQLLDKFKEERAGILNWAIEGAQRLEKQNGQFTEIPESAEILKQFMRENNSVSAFIDIHCRHSEGNSIDLNQFYSRYNAWTVSRISYGAMLKMVRSSVGNKLIKGHTLWDYTWEKQLSS